MSVRFEITTEPDTVAPGDLVVLRLVCCIKSIPDEVQMAITDEGEVA